MQQYNTNNLRTVIDENLDYELSGNITALKQVSFTVKSGEVLALGGRNGRDQGKVPCCSNCWTALIFPKAGELIAFGKPLSKKD